MYSLADAAAAMEGLDWDEVKKLIVDDIPRQEKRILDNIGITINMRRLATWGQRERAYRKAFGDGRLSRARCKVRSWLFPNRHAELVQAHREATYRTQAEMLNAIMEEVDERQAET